MQKMILLGRVTKDVELKTIAASGTTVVNFSIVTNRVRVANGEKINEACYFDVVAYGRLAELVGQYAKKGFRMCVQGFFVQQNWVDKITNQNRSKLILTAENIDFIDFPNNENHNKCEQINESVVVPF